MFAEFSAFVWAFQLAKNNGMKKIIVEGDAKLVVDALLSSPDDVRWDIAALINDAMCLASTFSSCKFGRIKREGNGLLTAEGDFSPKRAAGRSKKRRLEDKGLDHNIQTVGGPEVRNGARIGYPIDHKAKVADKNGGI